MSNDSQAKEAGTPLDKSGEATISTSPGDANIQATQAERAKLIARARTFLESPQVVQQNVDVKRRFLVEKGLHDAEIDSLLKDIPPLTPSIPPRNYPQLPLSNLPNLFIGLTRVFSWITGGSAVLIFIYWRFLLPRIARTYLARQSLRSHYCTLLQKLSTSLAAFKESQAESYSVLPRSEPYREPECYSTCQTIDEVLKVLDKGEPNYQQIPSVTLLRAAIMEMTQGKEQNSAFPTTDGLFRYLEERIPWLTSENGRTYEQTLWETLTGCPLFTRMSEPSNATGDAITTHWSYQPSDPPEPSRLQVSLAQLSSSLPRVETPGSNHHHTMQALSELTGYVSTQAYLPYRTISNLGGFSGSSSLLSPAEEELRREIRALKGLILNRRSFMASLPRAHPATQQYTSR